MSNQGFPSLTALLGLLAIAGYQNRDKIADLLGSGGQQAGGVQPGGGSRTAGQPAGGYQTGGYQTGGAGAPPQASRPGGIEGVMGSLATSLGGSSVGSFLGGGLRDLVDRFKQNGQGEVVESWVGTGPNKEIGPRQVEQAIGPDLLDTLSRQTGLSREELVTRLSRELPRAVDQYTPHGRLPTDEDFRRRG